MNEPGPGKMEERPSRAQLDYLVERRRLNDARDVLSTLLKEEPDDNELLFFAAYIDSLEGASRSAYQTVQRVLARDPGHERARALLFWLHESAERNPEAERVIIELIRDFPEEAHYYAVYSRLMLKTLNLEKATQLAREAVRLDPDNENGLAVSVLCAFVDNPTPAMENQLQELVRRFPDQIQTIATLVVLLAEQRRFNEAHMLAQELLRADPGNQDLVDLVVSLKVETHWLGAPLWPVRRFGWAASASIWAVTVIAIIFLQSSPYELLIVPIIAIFLLYVVYSWIYPPLMSRLLRR